MRKVTQSALIIMLAVPAGYASDLRDAVFDGHPGAVRVLLANGADINGAGGDRPPLCDAAWRQLPEMVTLLLDRGANVNARGTRGRTALHEAARWGGEHITRLLLARGADIRARDDRQQTALHLAASSSATEVVMLLLSAGADVQARDCDGACPLHSAAGEGAVEVAKLLLGKGADVQAAAQDGSTPLQHAARHGHAAVVRLLLERGAECPALWRAIFLGQPRAIGALRGFAETMGTSPGDAQPEPAKAGDGRPSPRPTPAALPMPGPDDARGHSRGEGADGRGTGVVRQGIPLVPLRAVVQWLGGTLSVDGQTKQVAVNPPAGAGPVAVVTIGSATAQVKGRAVSLPVAPVVIGGALYVPLDLIRQSLEVRVEWDDRSGKATVWHASRRALTVVCQPD